MVANLTRTTCRVCGSEELTPLFTLGDIYVSNFVSPEEAEAGYENCPKCPIDAELCTNCSLVQLKHTAPQELLYARKYWYRSGVTQTMRDALKDVADVAMFVTPIAPKDVILDIGSNDGTLLHYYPPEVFRIGVEPADNLANETNYGANGVCLIHNFWSEQAYNNWFAHLAKIPKAKIVTALGMFYDLEDPNQFIGDIAKVLHPKGGVFIAQLMCLRQTINSMDVGNFCHEHLEYYSFRSLLTLYEKNGLEIFRIEENKVNGGSYRIFAQLREGTDKKPIHDNVAQAFKDELEMDLHNPSILTRFYQSMLRNAQDCAMFIAKEFAKGKKIYVYGASTKGNTLLQWYGLNNRVIVGAADRDPAKWGKVTVGTGIPIMSEEAVRQMRPDYMLVLPYAFLDEFIEREKDQAWRRCGGKFIVPLPRFQVL